MISRLSTVVLAVVALLFSIGNAAPTSPLTPFKRSTDLKFPFGTKKVRGVSLGGWLVLEPWITPSLFEACDDTVVDEWTMGESLGAAEMLTRQQKHWSTWYTEDSMKEIAAAGLNFVRIPIGYWSVSPIPNTPYIQGAYPFLGQALDWAQKYGLMVLIDLHGAPGSQNGYDNSGHAGTIGWNQGETVAQTYTALNKIRDDHASHPAVAAIELLNEPYSPVLGRQPVRDFYTQGHKNLQANKKVAVTIQDAYQPMATWNSWLKGKANILFDLHPYQIFENNRLKFSLKHHIKYACSKGDRLKKLDSFAIAGEFTGAMTDCAYWLNGRNTGSRYDGTFPDSTYIGSCDGLSKGTVENLTSEQKSNIKTFITAQMTAWEMADGWIFWAWKTESSPEWTYTDLYKHGLIPKPGTLDGKACDGV